METSVIRISTFFLLLSSPNCVFFSHVLKGGRKCKKIWHIINPKWLNTCIKIGFHIMFTSGSKGNKVVSFAPGTDESDKEDKPGNNNSNNNNYSTNLSFSVHSIPFSKLAMLFACFLSCFYLVSWCWDLPRKHLFWLQF